MATGWKFQFSDERVSYLKKLLQYAADAHDNIAASGATNNFNRMSHAFSGQVARELLDEINAVTG